MGLFDTAGNLWQAGIPKKLGLLGAAGGSGKIGLVPDGSDPVTLLYKKYGDVLNQETIDALAANPSFHDPTYAKEIFNGIDQLRNSYKRLSGGTLNAEDINKYVQGTLLPAFNQEGELLGTDLNNLANDFINNNYDVEKLQRQKGQAEAPGQFGAVDQAFQSTVGRGATDAERQHFGQLLANGSLDLYSLGDWLQQLPESVQKKDIEFRNSVRSEAQSQDARYLNEQVLPGIESAFFAQGRDPRSSGFASAIAQAGTQQNRQREGFLLNLTAQQYMGNKQNAYDQYLNSVGRYQQAQDYSRNRAAQLSDAGRNRLYDIQDFNIKKQAYDDYFRRAGKRNYGGSSGAIQGAFSGGMTGGLVTGNPWGA